MVPVSFEGENAVVFSLENVEDFPEALCIRESIGDTPYVMTVWKLTTEEIKQLEKDPRIGVIFLGNDVPIHKVLDFQKAMEQTDKLDA
ncbi:MAG: hypothetical protein KatS3mg087_1393 [Patescibacteria group bacterium]|nr:MAG: hypothetical protein KatS3mg087_1393 [Patescibacteria group bacterium]